MVLRAVRRPVRVGQKLSRFHDADLRFDNNCKVCNITDGTLLYNIHLWRYNLNKSLKEISKKISEVDPTLSISEGGLSNHFRYHFPVEQRAALEVVTGSAPSGAVETRLRGYFEEKVKERIKPAHELEDLYERVSGWLDNFENLRTQSGTLSLVKDDIDPFVRLSGEMRGILSELNRIRQSDAVAKFCVQGFMSRFIEYLLKGLPDELNIARDEIALKIGGGVSLDAIMEKLKKGWAIRVKDSARLALMETCKEFGLK